jgi:hypothetical protein
VEYELEEWPELADELLDALITKLEEDRSGDAGLLEHGPDIAFLMIDWKIGYADRLFTHWTQADVREFLLDWFPRTGASDEETLAAVPSAMVAFLRFLQERRLLSGASIEALAGTVTRIRDPFHDAARGSDQAALDARTADFNLRSFEERVLVLGPSIGSTAAAGGRRTRRKAPRAARKRNRR